MLLVEHFLSEESKSPIKSSNKLPLIKEEEDDEFVELQVGLFFLLIELLLLLLLSYVIFSNISVFPTTKIRLLYI